MIVTTRDRYVEGMITAGIIFAMYYIYKENLDLKREIKSLKSKVAVSSTIDKAKNAVKGKFV